MVFFIPIVPGKFIGGMQENGQVYVRKVYSTIFNVFLEKMSMPLEDASYLFNNTVLIIELISIIIINVLVFLIIKKLKKYHKGENLC